jgi:hypothetical protein
MAAELKPKVDVPRWLAGAITAKELQGKQFDPVRYVLPGFIPEGVTLLVGKPKLGKSWAALDLCIAATADRFTFGTLKPSQGDGLYLALEDSQRRLKHRMAKLLPDGIAWPSRLTLQTSWRRANDGGLDDIEAWCNSVPDPTLIMIDTLEKFRTPPRSGTQSYSTDYEAITGLQAIAKARPGLGIVLLHHERKMDAEDPFDTVSGTLGLTGAADTILIMKRKDGAVRLFVRGRDVEESDTPLQFNKNTCRWTLMNDTVAAERHSTERQQIIAALTTFVSASDRDGMSVAEIMAATERTDRNAIDQLLFKMGRDGDIKRVRRGIYSLPQEAGKIGKKERNGLQPAENTVISGNLTDLTDLTGQCGPSPDDWSFHQEDEPSAEAARRM